MMDYVKFLIETPKLISHAASEILFEHRVLLRTIVITGEYIHHSLVHLAHCTVV